MGFHPLESVNVEPSAVHFVLLRRRLHGSGDRASRPESVSHRTPRVCVIGSKIARTIFTHLKAGRFSRNGQIDNTIVIRRRFDCVSVTRLVQFQSHVIRIEAGLRLVEAIIFERV